MTSPPRPFHLVLRLDHRADGFTDLSDLTETIGLAEGLGFDAVILADDQAVREGAERSGSLEPVTVLAAISAVTTSIGLVAPVASSLSQPYTIARRLSALDHISGGRAGWQPSAVTTEAERANFGSSELTAYEADDRRGEFVDVVTALWHSWDADARVIDKAAGIYVDLDRTRPINHIGGHFQVAGPIDTPRPPQGSPVLFTASPPSEWSQPFVRSVDALISTTTSADEARTTARELESALGAVERTRDEVRYLPTVPPGLGAGDLVALHDDGVLDGVTVLVDTPGESARATIRRFAELVPSDRRGDAASLRGRLGLGTQGPTSHQLQPAND